MITIKRTFCPGRGMIRPEELTGYVFSPEAAAHMFIITKMEKVDGQETAVPFDAGTDISCRFIKANGVTELVDGDLTDDGAASITLPAECYQVPGRFILSIYAETSEETICIYSATATALAGDTEEINVSGNTKRTIDAQIDALNDAVENAQETVEQVQEVIDSIPQDYTALSDDVGDLKSAVDALNAAVGIHEWPVSGSASTNDSRNGVLFSGLTLEPNTSYILTGRLDSAASAKAYIYVRDSQNTNIVVMPINIGDTERTGSFTVDSHLDDAHVDYALNNANHTVSAELTMATLPLDKVTSLENSVSEIKTDIYKTLPLPQLDVTFGQWGIKGNDGSRNFSNTHMLSTVEYLPEYIRSLTVADDAADYYFKLLAWNKTTGEYVGMWNGDGHGFVKTGFVVSRTNLKSAVLSEFGDYNYKITIVGPYEDNETMPLADASNVCGYVMLMDIPKNEDEEVSPENYKGKEICVFDDILCIGDSIIAGGGPYPDITPNPNNATRTVPAGTYSIPAMLTKMYGMKTTNMGDSGLTSRSWYNTYSGRSWSGHDAAIIRIGNNDWSYSQSDGEDPEGCAVISDIYVKAIIAKLKTDNPGIRIFLCTLNKSNSTDRLAQYRVPMMQKFREIAEDDPSVFLVDTNLHSNFDPVGGYYNGHPTAIGYQLMAQDIGSIISYIIAHENEKFKWVKFIGTEYAVTDDVTPGPDDDDDVG